VRRTSDLRFLNALKVRLIYGDLGNRESLDSIVAEKDYVYHLAGVKRARSRTTYYQINHVGTQSLIEACAQYNPHIKKFVLVSSLAACGPSSDGHYIKEKEECKPITNYGKSKLLGEQTILKWKDSIPVVIVRPPVIYGPRDRDLLVYFRWIKRGISLFIGKGTSYVSLCYVKDLVTGILTAGETPESNGQIYFITDDHVYDWQTIAEYTAYCLGKRVKAFHLSNQLITLWSLLMETISFFMRKPVILNKEKIIEASQPFWVCDGSKAKNELGFKPAFTFEEGMKATLAWYKNEKWL
jgi:nucleoside-diphosphate-sugar epimerase